MISTIKATIKATLLHEQKSEDSSELQPQPPNLAQPSPAPAPAASAPLYLAEMDLGDECLRCLILPHVTIVFLYLLPVRTCAKISWDLLFSFSVSRRSFVPTQEVNRYLWPLLLDALPTGARIITYTFHLVPPPTCDTDFDWPPEVELDGRSHVDRLRVYRVTRERQEAWRALGERSEEASTRQTDRVHSF